MREHRKKLPLLILNFDGLLGYCARSDPFADNCEIKYFLKEGAEKHLKHLQEKYQIAVIRRMSGAKFFKFEQYLTSHGITFDATYKDDRKNVRECPQDYDLIVKDFELSNVGRPTVILAPHDTEIESSESHKILDTIHTGQVQFDSSFVTILIPHIKLNSTPSFKQITNIVMNLNTILKYSLTNDFFAFRTDHFYKRLAAEQESEGRLARRWAEARERRRNRGRSAGRPGKLELISELMGTNLAAHSCLQLASQYSRLVNTVYGKMSEAAAHEMASKTFYRIRKPVRVKAEIVTVLLLYNAEAARRANPKVVATEAYETPCISLGSFCQKKPLTKAAR